MGIRSIQSIDDWWIKSVIRASNGDPLLFCIPRQAQRQRERRGERLLSGSKEVRFECPAGKRYIKVMILVRFLPLARFWPQAKNKKVSQNQHFIKYYRNNVGVLSKEYRFDINALSEHY